MLWGHTTYTDYKILVISVYIQKECEFLYILG
jgi:hypothetical protein